MKYLFKKYWYLMAIFSLISLPLLILGTTYTDKAIIVKGDTTDISDSVTIDYEYTEEGSFSTIFVISMEHSTILQNIICGMDDKAYVYEMSTQKLHFSNSELTQISKLQYLSAHQASIIKAYTEAFKINNEISINYKIKSVAITYYSPNSDLRIGDEVIAIDGYTILDHFEEFRTRINSPKEGMVFTILRDEFEHQITLNSYDLNGIGGYVLYDINYETIFPQIDYDLGNAGGPSGGFMKTLSIFNKLTPYDYSRGLKIAGTGTIEADGRVGKIGGIEQKVYAAFDDKIDIFFCPKENYDDALKAYNTLKNKERMALVMVEYFNDAIEYLENV